MVVAEKSRAVKGKFLEIVGHYLPTQNPKVITAETERIAYWISMGAVPSDTVARLLHRQGVKGMDKFMVRYAKRKSKNAPPEVAAPVAAPAAPAPVETATPEIKAEEAPVATPEVKTPEVKIETPAAAPEVAAEAPAA